MPAPLEFDKSNIDADSGIIRDVVMVQEGEAKGHGIYLEAEFIQNLVEYDRANYGERGVKARLGHPGLSDDAQGTQMGYFRNVRERKSDTGKMQAIADLHLLESSNASPSKPGMREWTLKMAAEAPDFIMSSIVFSASAYYQRRPDGGKNYVEWDWHESDWINLEPKMGEVFAEFSPEAGSAHYYTDLVEAGAATDSLFSNQANPRLFVARFGIWLDENPEIRDFIHHNPDKVQAFLDRVGFSPKPTKQPRKMGLKELFFGKEAPSADTALTAEEVQELRTAVSKAETALQTAADETKLLKKQLADANARITELEKTAAAAHTETAASDDDTPDVKSWDNDPINQRARKAFSLPRRKQ